MDTQLETLNHELRASEERLRALPESITDISWDEAKAPARLPRRHVTGEAT